MSKAAVLDTIEAVRDCQDAEVVIEVPLAKYEELLVYRRALNILIKKDVCPDAVESALELARKGIVIKD